MALEQPQHAAAPKETDQAAKVKALNETPQQAPKAKASDPGDSFFLPTGVKVIQVAELDFIGDNDERIIGLQSEEVDLLAEVEHLKEMLQTQTALSAETCLRDQTRIKILQLEIIERESTEKEVLRKVRKLEETLDKEKDRQKEVESSLAHQREENSRLVAALVQAEEDLKRDTLKWEEEKSRLLQCIKEQQQETKRDHLRNRTVELEQKMVEINKKPKKRSLWKRFLQLFK